MSTLEARIAEVLADHIERKTLDDYCEGCSCGWNAGLADAHEEHVAAMLAPIIREAQAEASAQAFQAVRDNAEFETEERDGAYVLSPATLYITVDKLNGLETSHDGVDWVRYTATDFCNEIDKAKAEAWDAGRGAWKNDTNPYRSTT